MQEERSATRGTEPVSGKLCVACAVDCVVLADIEIVCVRGKFALVQKGDIGKGLVLGGSHNIYLAVF